MGLELSRLYELRAGRLDPVIVGPLSPHGVAFLRAKTRDVYLSRESFAHIERDHPDISAMEMIRSADAIWRGLLIGYGSTVIASYRDPDTAIRYKAVVKSARGGFDLWLTTFHRTAPRQTKKLVNRGIILQAHF